MSESASSIQTGPGDDPGASVRYYKKDFWSDENLKFSRPWYRLEKSARIISNVASGRDCTLLDIGCGPATLMGLLPPNIQYCGIDIAIHNPAPNLIEADILQAPIRFQDRRFDVVIAEGVFEYLGEFQEQKFAEIGRLLNADGKFIVTYTNFGHRRRYIYPAFSNIQRLSSFRDSLAAHFQIDREFPESHNWKHAQPNRSLVKSINMRVNFNIPVISSLLAVEYYFICSPLPGRAPN